MGVPPPPMEPRVNQEPPSSDGLITVLHESLPTDPGVPRFRSLDERVDEHLRAPWWRRWILGRRGTESGGPR